MGKGFTITRARISTGGVIKLIVFSIFFIAMTVTMFIWEVSVSSNKCSVPDLKEIQFALRGIKKFMFSCIYLYFDVITKDQIRCGLHLNIWTCREQLQADLGICSDKHLQVSNGSQEVIVKTWLFQGHEKTLVFI